MLNAEKHPRFSTAFKATSSVVFLGTTHGGSPAISSSLFEDPFEKTKVLVDADDPKTIERNKLEPLGKDSDVEFTPKESLYASPFSEPGSEALLPLGSPQSEGGLSLQYNYLSLDTAVPSREPSARVFLFDIERDGDPRVEWIMYYDFIVTKSEAYYQLQPGYLPTEKYPSCVSIK